MRPVALRTILLLLLLLLATAWAYAGGGPENVLIVVNARSPESLEIGNAYRRARAIPYRNLLTLATAPTFTTSPQAYLDEIETPIRTYLENRQLADTITCIVLTRGIPQLVAVDTGRATASLLAAMRLRHEQPLTARLPNPYANALMPMTPRPPDMRGLYLVTTLTGYTTRDVAALITHGITADGSAPDGRFILQGSPHIRPADNQAAAELLTQHGLKVERPLAPPRDGAGIMGYLSGGAFSGLSPESLARCTFRPGALADLAEPYSASANNLEEHAPSLYFPLGALVSAGVTGLHGVVGDAGLEFTPATGSQAILLDRYTRGFSLAESFYAALPFVSWQNLIIGDPLCTPYARRPSVTLEVGDGPLRGNVPVRITAAPPDRGATVRRVDLYLDGQFLQTVYEPGAATLALRIGDRILQHPVPSTTDLRMLITSLAERINLNTELARATGVRAVASPETGTLQLFARTPGEDGNQIAVAVNLEGTAQPLAGVGVKAASDHLTGGGVAPTSAHTTIAFLGRRVKAGDQVSVKIGQERFDYTIPEANASMTALLDDLVAAIGQSPTLGKPDGVRATRDVQGMPVILLEARTAGDRGNKITVQVTVKAGEGSALRGVPETVTSFNGGHDGTAASMLLHFVLGEASVTRTCLLDTGKLADGAHQLRVVAIDGTPLQTQGFSELAITTANQETPPTVALPVQLDPMSGEAMVPVTTHASVKRVDLYVDGQLLGTAANAPFTIRVPLANLGRGEHDLWAEGVNADGKAFRSATTPLTILVAPEVARIVPDHTILAGGTVHRIVGTGFTPNCAVRLAGIPVRAVRFLSPNTLEVTADAGQVRRGWVEVTNADGTVGTLPNAFEYYVPRVADVRITPAHDIIRPGQAARFSAPCFDQFGHPLPATVIWEATGGVITQQGFFTAPLTPGPCVIRASHPDSVKAWEVPVTVGAEEVRDGVLRQWLVLGPFPDGDATGLERALIPETTVLPAHGITVEKMSWRSLAAPNTFIDLGAQYTSNTNAVAYAHVYLKAPAAINAQLVFGSDDGIRLWLNGEQVYSLHVYRAADPNQATLPVRLKEGWNRLLVKVDQGGGTWGFYLRLQTTDGKPLSDLTCALDTPPELQPAP